MRTLTSERILVMGAGSMGTMLGARLTAAGFSVELADVNREHVEALNARGASVVGTVDWQVPVIIYFEGYASSVALLALAVAGDLNGQRRA